MQWVHRVSREWMLARQSVLTASDIKDLIPVTATGRPRKITEKEYLKVLSRKHKLITDEDLVSTGWAARGHIMEPYALREFNDVRPGSVPYIRYWDDKLVANDWLGYSPDGLDIDMPNNGFAYVHYDEIRPGFIFEVKSYSPENHNNKGHSSPMSLEERWQIATAMTVSPSIYAGYLILFNPSYPDSMFVHEYNRDDLSDEIDTINKIKEPWQEFLNDYYSRSIIEAAYTYTKNDIEISEEDIYADWSARKELNPR